jgi:acetyl esterase/lipase
MNTENNIPTQRPSWKSSKPPSEPAYSGWRPDLTGNPGHIKPRPGCEFRITSTQLPASSPSRRPCGSCRERLRLGRLSRLSPQLCAHSASAIGLGRPNGRRQHPYSAVQYDMLGLWDPPAACLCTMFRLPYRPRTILSLAVTLLFAGSMAQADIWQPSAGHVQTPIWPGAVPDALPNPKPESVGPEEGKEWWPRANDVSQPTMTMYAPVGHNTGVAVVVFPGGGYRMLAMDLEGTEICDWLTSRGMTCVLLKYRVPGSGPWWDEVNKRRVYPKVQTALQDAQRTLGLVRQHAAEWHVDPHKIGVIGFSAGGHLVAALSSHFDKRLYAGVDAADQLSCRPDFAIALYPGHIWAHEDDEEHSKQRQKELSVRPDITIRADSPPSFIAQAEDDKTDDVQESLTYYLALKQAGVPAEMHLYAQGGHAFGLRSTLSVAQWPKLVEKWLGSIGMLDATQTPR